MQVGGTARICRGDAGTENVNIAAMQRFSQAQCSRRLSGVQKLPVRKTCLKPTN